MLQIDSFCYWYRYWYCNLGSSNIDIDIEIQFPLSHSPGTIHDNCDNFRWKDKIYSSNSILSPLSNYFFDYHLGYDWGNLFRKKTNLQSISPLNLKVLLQPMCSLVKRKSKRCCLNSLSDMDQDSPLSTVTKDLNVGRKDVTPLSFKLAT